jgi:GPH family glycoside/pentoside/hexuronide:cation symporter
MSLLARLRDRRLTGTITRGRTVAFGASAFPIQLMSQTFAAFVVFFYVDHLRVPAAWIGAAMIAHGILNALLNPLVGAVSDRARTRWGRRVPWIGLGVVPLLVSFALIWLPPDLPAGALAAWFVVVVALYDIAFVAVVLNVSALFPELFRTTAERARGNTPRQLFGLLGMILGTALAPLLYGNIGWAGMAGVLVVVCAAFFAWSFRGMIERPAAETAQPQAVALTWRQQLGYTFGNRAFVPYVLGSLLMQSALAVLIAALPFYVRYSLAEPDTAGTLLLASVFLAALVTLPLWSWFVRRTTPRSALLASVAVFTVSAAGYALVPGLIGAMCVGALVGVGVSGILQLLEIALSQVIDEDAERTGLRREGVYFGVNGFVVRGSVIVQAVVFAVVLAVCGYDAAAGSAQAPGVDAGIRALVGIIPAVLSALAWLCFLWFPLRTRDAAGIVSHPEEVRTPVADTSE